MLNRKSKKKSKKKKKFRSLYKRRWQFHWYSNFADTLYIKGVGSFNSKKKKIKKSRIEGRWQFHSQKKRATISDNPLKNKNKYETYFFLLLTNNIILFTLKSYFK